MSARRRSRTARALALLAVALAAVLLRRALRTGGTDTEPTPPTVVLIVWDSVAIERLAPYGGAPEVAPHLAQLVRESVVFDEHVPSSDGTNSALASLLTGRYPRRHGVGRIDAPSGARLGAEHATLPELFAAQGFRTIASFALAQLAPQLSGLGRGFALCAAPSLMPLERARDARATFDAVRGELEESLASRTPVFALLHFADARAREQDRAPGAARWLAQRLAPWRAAVPEVEQALAALPDEPERALELLSQSLLRRRGDPARAAYVGALYDARVAEMDAVLGELLALLERSGRRAAAVIALCGARAGELPGDASSAASDDPAPRLRAPFLLRLRGGAWTARSSAITQDVDLFPSLLSAAGIAPPTGVDGFDLAAEIVTGGARAGDRAAAFVEDERFERRLAVGRECMIAESLARGARAFARNDAVDAVGIALDELPDVPRELTELEALLARFPPLGRLRLAWCGAAPAPAVVARAPEGMLAPPELAVANESLGRIGPVQTFALAASPGAELAQTVLRAAARAPDLALAFAHATELEEELIHIGGTPLLELDATLFPVADAPAWPLDEADRPAPAAVSIESQGGWTSVTFGGEPDRACRAVVELLPFELEDPRALVQSDADTAVSPHPRRPGALVVEGKAPLAFRIRRRSAAAAAFAFFVDGRRIAAREIRAGERCFAAPGALELCLAAGAWSDPAFYTAPPADAERGPGLWIELLDPPPSAAFEPPTPEQLDTIRTLANTEHF